jgi:hypothetical protein
MSVELRTTAFGALLSGVALVGSLGSCSRQPGAPEAPEPSWIHGTDDQRFAQIETHLRGLDVAMTEIGYRYAELYFAVEDTNWEYADYQLEKIDLALELAVERRPKRAQSAAIFLAQDLPDVRAGVGSREPAQASAALERLRASCMKCHVAENVPFMIVGTPQRRQSKAED